MNNESSLLIYQKGYEAELKLDYFLCGGAGALFAYIGEHYEPHILNHWFYFLTPITLLCLTLSLGLGLLRLHYCLAITKLNQEATFERECNQNTCVWLTQNSKKANPLPKCVNQLTNEEFTIAELDERKKKHIEKALAIEYKSKKLIECADCIGHLRTFFLISGFIIIILTKLLQPYFSEC
jgi:hypothetical protein